MYDIALLKEKLATPKRVVIVMHARPDADALGTSLALALYLKSKGHRVDVIAPTEFPDFLSWLPDAEHVLLGDTHTAEEWCAQLGTIDILFGIDFSTINRLEGLSFIFQNPTIFKVIIDHHIEPDDIADLFFWDPKAAASAEILWKLLSSLEQEEKLTPAIATCLYAGMVTDTNSFRNPNTTAHTHRIAADLLEHGVDGAAVQRHIYGSKSLASLQFFGFAISQRLVTLPELHAAYFVIQKEDCRRYGLKSGDTEGLVDYALSIKDTLLAAVLKEKGDMVYLSLRSVGDIAANEITQKYFNGGGHKNAAGGVSSLSLAETVDKFEQILHNI